MAVHAFVPSVLLRVARLGQARNDPQPNPANRQLREPLDRVRRKWCSVIREDALGESVLPEEPFEDGPNHLESGRGQTLTANQIPTERVGHRQRVAVAAISGSEVAL